MSNAVAFDTLKFLERLKTAGVPEGQAKGQTEALADVLASGVRDLATKQDLASVETALRHELASTSASLKQDLANTETALRGEMGELRRDMKEMDANLQKEIAFVRRDMKEMDGKLLLLEQRMTIKLGGMILAGIGLMFGLMRVWPMPVQTVPPTATMMPPPALMAPQLPAQR